MSEQRQVYVGHRYVPKIMGEWSPLISYEGLSIVLNEGDSYTSKKMVPIGIPLSNKEYWVVTGNYNAQIEYYRQEVENLKEETTTEFLNQQSDLNSRGVNIKEYMMEVVDNDWTSVIQKTLDTHKHAIVPSGIFIVNATIEVNQGQVLELENGATLIKKSNSNNTNPVVWLKSSHGVLRGHNRMTSSIQSERETPFGVVCLGYLGMTDTIAKNVLYCTIVDIGIFGHVNGGKTEGTSSLVLNLANPQIDNMASYFHSLDRLYIAKGNVGLMLEGYANANIIGDIQFYKVGDNKLTNDNGAIVLKNTDGKAPLDNIINGIFHHTSTNADTLVFDGNSFYNSLTNINSEQGGPLARWINQKNSTDLNVPRGNIITGIDNVSGSISRSDAFLNANTIIARSSMHTSSLTLKTLTSSESIISNKLHFNEVTSENSITKKFLARGLSENKSYKILEIDLVSNKGMTGIIDFSLQTDGSVDSFIQSYSGQITIKVNLAGIPTITKGSITETLPTYFVSGVIGTKIYIGVKLATNGTSINSIDCHCFYTIKGQISTGIINEIKDNTGEII